MTSRNAATSSKPRSSSRDMVDLLLSRGADPHLPGDKPWGTALAWAIRRGQTEVAARLRQLE